MMRNAGLDEAQTGIKIAGRNINNLQGGNRTGSIESRTPSWTGLWTLSYMPSIYGNNIPTGKPDPQDGRAPVLVPRLCHLKEYPNYLYNRRES